MLHGGAGPSLADYRLGAAFAGSCAACRLVPQSREGLCNRNLFRDAGCATEMSFACRLVPRSGEGPSIRDRRGQEIDEYLMRLLRSGAANAADATMYRQEVHTHSSST